ncbi:MAG: BON domain-containing protein [Gammaproteobacteria bacterium]|jgi:osmotically-inducible protein OsmY|nr:BON domain-containing protein [Gammaproteobacteria bacterium]
MFKTIVTLLLIITGLALIQGCAGLVVAGAAVGAVAASDPRSSKVMMDDKVIEMKATDKIYSDRELQTRVHVNVYSYNYVVLLTGEALSQNLKDKAVDIVRNINNVSRVHNEIRIADLTSFESRAKDSWISSKIKTNMLGTKNFQATKVEVITENRTVFMMGFVTEEQGAQAAEIARQVEGVEKVVKLFEYIEADEAQKSGAASAVVAPNKV